MAYRRHGRQWFRSKCATCIYRAKGLKAPVPRWQSHGYKKKRICDRCGFRARHQAQLLVYHIDGDLNNCDLRNLRTVCLNCTVEISKLEQSWAAGDLEADR